MLLALLAACGAPSIPSLPVVDSGVDSEPPSGPCGLWLEQDEAFAIEGETLEVAVECTRGGGPIRATGLPEGAELDADGFSWRPAGDAAGSWSVVFSAPGEGGFPESAVLTVQVSDNPDKAGNEPVNPLGYTREYGLPVLHLAPQGSVSDQYVDATVTWEGVEYPGRMKKRGAASLGYPKVGYTLDFDEEQLDLGEQGMGRKAHLVLISTFDDNSYARQLLSYGLWADMAEHFGAHRLVVRTFPVVVYVDGEYLGLYVAADHVDDEFLQQLGLDRDSALYKAVSHDADFTGSHSSLHAGYEIKEGESWASLDALVAFTASADSARIVAEGPDWFVPEEFMDWFLFVYFSAADDSAGKNSYIAFEPGSQLARFAPWDFNHCWGQDWRTLRVDSLHTNTFRSRNKVFLAQQDADGSRLWARFAELVEQGPMSEEALLERLDDTYEDIDPAAARDWERWAGQYRSYGGWSSLRQGDWTTYEEEKAYLRQWIVERVAWAEAQL